MDALTPGAAMIAVGAMEEARASVVKIGMADVGWMHAGRYAQRTQLAEWPSSSHVDSGPSWPGRLLRRPRRPASGPQWEAGHSWDAFKLAFLQGTVSGSCVTSAADCGVRRVLSRRRNSSQLGDQPKSGTRDIIV